ncbi:MAG: hypothetical protein ACM3US_15510 [Sphingomonadaceae bacterium]
MGAHLASASRFLGLETLAAGSRAPVNPLIRAKGPEDGGSVEWAL